MANRSFLTPEETEQAQKLLVPPVVIPDGDETQSLFFPNADFSRWLSLHLEARMKDHPDWRAAGPVAVGSWARGELCPKSDFDLLFCGSEDAVRRLADDMHRAGLKLRYRMPQDMSDWTQGVEPFDVLALVHAKPFTPEGAHKLLEQQSLIRARGVKFRKVLLKAMVNERRARAERYDSISNFLEPNLKYGPGGCGTCIRRSASMSYSLTNSGICRMRLKFFITIAPFF